MKNFYILVCCFLSLAFHSAAQNENALHFDNVDDHTVTPNASALISGTNGMSITCWVYPQNQFPTYPDYDGFIGFRNNTDADFYMLQLTSSNVEARFRSSSGQVYNIVFTGLQLNTWQHFALTYDAGMLRLFHNGILSDSIAASGQILNNAESFYTGMLPWTGANFYMNGMIDEASLWSKALSAPEVDCIYNSAIDPSDPDVKLYYRFNQGTANGTNTTINTATDGSGHINANLMGFGLAGSTSNWVNGITTLLSSSVSDTICPGTTFVFGSQTITLPGTYFESFPITGSCDSIAQLTLEGPVINTAVGQAGPVLTSQQSGASYQWIDCLNGNAPVPGATGQTFTATANGQYAVVVTYSGCSDTSVCLNVTNVGFSEHNSNHFQVFPVPAGDQVHISFAGISQDIDAIITSAQGKIMWQGTLNGTVATVDTQKWPPGFYVFIIPGTGARQFVKTE